MSSNIDMLAGQGMRVVSDTLRRNAEADAIAVHPNTASRLVFLTEPTGLATEQYKMLRRRLCAHHPQGGLLLITSPTRGDGKTLTSVNLAWCLSEGGHRTCLVDLDFRAPSVASVLNYSVGAEGIDDVVRGGRTIGQSLRQIGSRGLSVLPVRRSTDSPSELLSAAALGPVLKELKAMFQWVVLDLPPAVPTADVAEVLPHADGALLIIRAHRTNKAAIAGPVEILGAKLWGVVLNDTLVDGSSYYNYYGDRSKSR